MDIYETYIENVIQLADEAMNDGNYEEAKSLLESGLMEEPGYAKLHMKMGDFYQYHLKNPGLSEMHYQLAIKFNPTLEDAYEELIELYNEHKKYAGLRYWMLKAEKVEGLNKAFVYTQLGLLSEREGGFQKAIEYFKKALLDAMDNYDTDELKKHIKRNKYKSAELGKKSGSA
ncbi:hypothetical protein [Roseivirga sp. 4D4]|uniref:hypothetical protein n=1 Tax=Roseivirga sp. 4D4 TaxID=1889784 RepID=UPI00147F0101|nr:hypothetical protein [Roseivirga sp. 4D4]